MDAVDQLRPFLEPRSVAVVGASPGTGPQAFNVVENLVQSGYQGQVYPVNPKHTEIAGLRSYASVRDIPGDVDLAIIVTPRGAVLEVVEQCGAKGVRAAVVVGGGFADADEEGERLQRRLAEVARAAGVRVLGPNTVGSANAFTNFSTSFVKQTDMRKLPVGVVCQSGMFFGTVGRLSLLGKGLDLGNSCDVDAAEALEYFAHDPDVKVIVLHMEGVRDGRRFVEAARQAAGSKPILALKTGRSTRAATAARSHTGSLVGRDEVWEAVFRQCGVIRADGIDELADLAKAFSCLPLMRGRGVGVVTAMGGAGAMSVDACARYGLEVVELAAGARRRLNDMCPSWFRAGNPLDIWPVMMMSRRSLGETLRAVMGEVLGDPSVNGLLLFAGAWFESFSPPITEVVGEMADAFPEKPIAWCPYEGWLYDVRGRDLGARLEAAGKAAVFSTPDDALRALSGLAKYAEFLRTGT